MGTDIHGIFQRRDGAGWKDIPARFEINRHYQLFAVLAGVRNGFGFAGIPLGDPVTPIAEPRGLPADFEVGDDCSRPVQPDVWAAQGTAKYYKPGEDGYGRVWMGDHSHSWLLGSEILAWAESAPVVTKWGVIERAVFDSGAWKKGTEPDEYSGAVSGRRLSTVEQAAAEAGAPSTHVRVRWNSGLRKELSYFFEEVARLHAEHGEVRFVFGFDS